MIVEILFMMKKKGCDYMFKKLVMLLCFGILLSFNVANAQTNDELPPLVIETDDVKYAGIMLKLDKNPTITARQETAIHKEPSPNSPVVGTMQRNDKVSIVGAKAYIYPRMGKTRIIKDVTLKDEFGNEKSLKYGDVVYLISCDVPSDYVVWYKGAFLELPAYGVKMPNPYIDVTPYKEIYAEYEGYTNKQDVEADFEMYIEYPNDDPHTPMSTWKLVYGDEFRRNADIWLYVELPDKVTRGWVQLLNAHLGSKTYKQIWWRQLSVEDLDVFYLGFDYEGFNYWKFKN